MTSFKKMILFLLAFAVLVFIMLYTTFDDVQINKYPTMDEVREDTAIERGWIPAILPESAYDISETHDIDTNELFGSFTYKEQDEETFMKMLTLIPDTNETYRWEKFLFKIDEEKNSVKFRNDPGHP